MCDTTPIEAILGARSLRVIVEALAVAGARSPQGIVTGLAVAGADQRRKRTRVACCLCRWLWVCSFLLLLVNTAFGCVGLRLLIAAPLRPSGSTAGVWGGLFLARLLKPNRLASQRAFAIV